MQDSFPPLSRRGCLAAACGLIGSASLAPFPSFGQTTSSGKSSNDFIWPGHGVPIDRPVWGLRDGIRIGLHPTKGPRGLIRIYTPYLDQPFPTMINFLSIEPRVKGKPGRGQSELEESQEMPGTQGLSFYASNTQDDRGSLDAFPSGNLSRNGSSLSLFVHSEPFRNGARPVVEVILQRQRPHEIQLVTHAAQGSAEMTRCTISATMGNYGLMRRLYLRRSQIIEAKDLWPEGTESGHMGFYKFHEWPTRQLLRRSDGRVFAVVSSDFDDPSKLRYDRRVAKFWHYQGQLSQQYWMTERDAEASVAVNGRSTYWKSQAPIPGGVSYENFELRMPFEPGRKLWFGVKPA